MTENKTNKKPLERKLTVTVIVIAGMALAAIFLTAVLRPDKSPTTTPEEMRAAIKELVAQGYKEEITNSFGMKFRLVPPGTFMMGSPDPPGPIMAILSMAGSKIGLMEYRLRNRDACPRHEVILTEPFYMGVHEVTQEQYEKVMGKNPSGFKGKNFAVENVSWDDTIEFCKKLSDMEKTSHSLPTEAQWEYACRAGTETTYHWGDEFDSRYAWISQNSGGTNDVGTLQPNSLGLYDMSGNAAEWCSDWYGPYSAGLQKNPSGPVSGSFRALRGGGYTEIAQFCASAFRYGSAPADPQYGLGFRVIAVRPRSR